MRLYKSISAVALAACAAALAQNDWPTYGRDLAGTRYSPLKQIDSGNVSKLVRAWTYHMTAESTAPKRPAEGNEVPAGPGRGRGGGGGRVSEVSPLIIGGVMYITTGYGRVVALEPETGKPIWTYEVKDGAPAERGLEFWAGDAQSPPELFFGTSTGKLIALNAKTGKPVPGFGNEGLVDMKPGALNGLTNSMFGLSSPPIIYKNLVITGAHVQESPSIGASGDTRAWDVHTGKLVWTFHSVPRPGEPGSETWEEPDSWKNRSGTNVWGMFTVDAERGILYMPFGEPTTDYWGGDRKGANLYGNSVVAVEIQTGKYKWHFQTIHHDLWDHDPPAPPTLFNIVRNGNTIPALVLTTKSGYMYILNRETGVPVFGVEERPVAKSDVPGEQAFPTQPFPVKPPPIARTSYRPEDLVKAEDTTPEHAQACRDLIARNGSVNNSGPFTPWLYRPEGAPVKSTLTFPGGVGGANWGGVAWDPATGYAFVVSQDEGALGWVEKTRDGSPVPYDRTMLDGAGPGRGNFEVRVRGAAWPCQKPPWGRLTAVNTATGDFAWQIPLGVTEGLPDAKQNTGRPARAGAIVTGGGVLFVGSTDDNRFRAINAKTGKQLWLTKLDRRANASPMTYQGANGKRYVAVVASDTLSVFALP